MVGVFTVLVVASCSAPSHREQSLRQLYRDPLLTTAPPGVGEVQQERQTTDCSESGGEPAWTLSRALDGEGQQVLDQYKSMALRTGWEVITEKPFDPAAPFEGRGANLVMHRSSETESNTTLVVAVDVGTGPAQLHQGSRSMGAWKAPSSAADPPQASPSAGV